MFDSKKLLDALIQGAVAPQGGQQGGGLGSILGQLAGAAGQQQGGGAGGLGGLLGGLLGGAQQQQGAQAQQAGAGGLGDLLGGLLGGAKGGQGQAGGAGGLGDLLGGLLGGAQQQAQSANQKVQDAGGLGNILGSLLGQAAGGARDAAQDADQATGASSKLQQMIEQATGRKVSPEMLGQLQELIANNKLAAGAAAGGLGGLLLGTKTGRNITTTAAKLGGLALIGGLAYKAYQNYLEGKPLVQFGEPVAVPPKNSAFSPNAGDPQQNATLMLRGMIAAAAADGTIDEAEKKAILGSVQAQGMDQDTLDFLNNEVANPADAATLASEVQGPEQATALYTACLLAIDVNNRQERRFMDELAETMGLDEQLVAQIKAAAQSVAQTA